MPACPTNAFSVRRGQHRVVTDRKSGEEGTESLLTLAPPTVATVDIAAERRKQRAQKILNEAMEEKRAKGSVSKEPVVGGETSEAEASQDAPNPTFEPTTTAVVTGDAGRHSPVVVLKGSDSGVKLSGIPINAQTARIKV